MNDTELLRRYVQEGSQEAFAELVKLRIGLVYSAALRQTGGDAAQAQDVTQVVFTDLARKAASLCRHRALIGWLYTSTRFAAGKMARTERRRQAREQEAFSMQQDLAPTFPEIPADRLRPLLDEAMHDLAETDRHALLLRFFDDCSMAELGRTLGLSESAAQKRVERALAKLRDRLARRGLSSTAAAIGAALSQAAAATVVPTGLAATVTHGALTAAATTATGIGLLSTLSTPLIYTVGATGFIAAMAVGTVIYERQHPAPAPTTPVVPGTSMVDGAALPYVQLVDHSQSAPDESTAVAPGNPLPADLAPLTSHSALQPVPITSTPPAQPPSSPAPLGITLIAPGDSANAAHRDHEFQAFNPSQLDQQPVATVQVRPTYPAEMRHAGISGQVLVDFFVDSTGRVHNAVAVHSSRDEFEQAAVDAVSQWRFQPGRRGGRNVTTHLQAPIIFTLNSHD